MITITEIKKPVRTYKGATLELRPITANDCGIVKDSKTATLWARNTGLWSEYWVPCQGETALVVASFRKEVLKKRALIAKRRKS